MEVSLKTSNISDLNTKHTAGEPLQIFISLNNQRLSVFRGLKLIDSSKISSGKNGHQTPRGIFSVLEKRSKHRSNIYRNARMPFMQRLTWSGIALHESRSVPNYPASHGCIRLPNGFAKSLFRQTNYRDHVIIAPETLAPKIIEHPALFQPDFNSQESYSLRQSKNEMDYETAAYRIKMIDKMPLRIYITRHNSATIVKNIQSGLKQLLIYEGEIDGAFGPNTRDSIVKFQKLYGFAVTGKIDEKFRHNLSIKAERSMISDGVIYIRKNHKSIYQSDLNIINPQLPLGSHLVMSYKWQETKTKWLGTTISSKIKRSIVRFNDIDLNGEKRVNGSIDDALSRVILPIKIRRVIESLLTAGSSIAISDNGLGTETGTGTDFIVQTD